AHPRGAVRDRTLDHAPAARVNILDGEVALHRGNGADRLADAAMTMAAAAEQAGLVEMDVGVDEARQHHAAGGVDLCRLADKVRRNRGDLAAGDADVDRLRCGPRAGVTEDEIEGRSREHGQNLAEAAGEGTTRLCAIWWQNCSKYVHAIWSLDCRI